LAITLQKSLKTLQKKIQLCNATLTKEIAMFEFEKPYKQYEAFLEQVKQAGEFWINSYLSSIKEFFKKI
jgi:hypothetical protein